MTLSIKFSERKNKKLSKSLKFNYFFNARIQKLDLNFHLFDNKDWFDIDYEPA